MENYVITIARGFGSGGKEIGTKLAAELGIPCYEQQLLEMAAEKSGFSIDELEKVDEKLKSSYLSKKISQFAFDFRAQAVENDFVSDDTLFRIQSEIIQELAKTQSCIVIGKCADYVLRKNTNVLSVYVEAPRESCVHSIMQKLRVSDAEANHLIETTDKYRSDYYKYYTHGKKWTDPANYDLTLNSARIGRDACVGVIENALKLKFKEQ